MEEYTSNSDKSKEQRTEDKNIEKVASGHLKSKKNSGLKKFADVFISDDVNSVKSYILMDVIIPAIKRGIVDAINIILYGDTSRSKKSSPASKVSYRSYYESENDYRRDDRISTNRNRNRIDYDEVLFDTRGEAETVLDRMYDILREYGIVSVSDFYEISDIPNDNYMLNRYGWNDLSGTKVARTRDGYIITLTKARPID